MDMRELTIQKREGTGKGPARRLRRARARSRRSSTAARAPVNIAVTPQATCSV